MRNYRAYYSWILVIIVLTLTASVLQAQSLSRKYEKLHKQYSLTYRTFRVTLLPGLSTNGINASQYASKYSWNILAGYNGALDEGFEFGSIINANKYYAHGVQLAGIGNYSGRETAGIQLAGVFNYAGRKMQGIQLSGTANISRRDMQGVQITGFLNWSSGAAQGIQVAGVLNIARREMQGLFFTGAGNISSGNMEGIHLAGFTNFSQQQMQGVMISGFLNYSQAFQGIAIGSINISSEAQGIQIANLNIAEDMQGIQVGLINYARSMAGLPVGLISYYGDGRKNIDVWTSDAGFINTGLKLGTHEVYNMLSIGYNPLLNRDVWQVGWSIGRLHEYSHHFMYSDFSIFKINENGWTKDLNSLIKYRLLFGMNLDGGLRLYGGPALNMLVTRVPESRDYTWYRLINFEVKQRNYIFWIGYSVGVELF